MCSGATELVKDRNITVQVKDSNITVQVGARNIRVQVGARNIRVQVGARNLIMYSSLLPTYNKILTYGGFQKRIFCNLHFIVPKLA